MLISSIKKQVNHHDSVLAVHEITKLYPAAFREIVHFLVGDCSLASLLNCTESAKNVAGFFVSDRATSDFGKVNCAWRSVSEKKIFLIWRWNRPLKAGIEALDTKAVIQIFPKTSNW